MIIAQTLGSVLEIGAISIIAVAIGVLTGEIEVAPFLASVDFIDREFVAFFADLPTRVLFIWLVISAVVLQLIKSGLGFVSRVVRVRICRLADEALAGVILKIALRSPFYLSANDSPGYSYELIEQGKALNQEVIGGLFSNAVTATLALALFGSVMLAVSWELTLTAFGLLAGAVLVLRDITSRLKTLTEAVTQKRLRLSKQVVEYLGSHRILRLLNQTSWAEKKIFKDYKRVLGLDEEVQIADAKIDPVIQIGSISGIGLFLIGAVLIFGEGKDLLLPTIVGFLILLHRALQHARSLVNIQVSIGRVRILSGYLGEYLLRLDKFVAEPVTDLKSRPVKNEIRIENLSFQYPGSIGSVLTGVEFTIPSGTTLAVVGPSGAGKSTLIDLLAGLYSPTTGRILFDGIDSESDAAAEFRRSFGVVDQTTLLLDASIMENIRFGRSQYSDEEVVDAAKMAHADEFILELSQQYQTLVGRGGFRISGGQKQRIAIARALLSDPSVLILDEATSALDSETESLFQEMITKVRSKRIIVMIAHRLSTVRGADVVIVMERGQIVESGNPQDLLDQGGRFSDLWRYQSFDLSDNA